MFGDRCRRPDKARAALRGAALAMTGLLITACDGGSQAGAGGNTPWPAPGGGGVHTVFDPLGPNGPGPALDVSPPPGWQVQSTVRWDNTNGQCSYAMASPVFRMTRPDGRASIEQLPGFLVTTSEQDIRRRGSAPGDFCIIAMAETGQALAQRVAIPFLRPQARILNIRDIPYDPVIASMQPRMQQFQSSGMPLSLYMVEATIENPDRTIEKIVLGGMIFAGQQMAPGVPPLVLNQNLVAYAVRAPADQLAETETLAARVRASIRPRPEWQNAVNARMAQLTAPVFPRGGGGTGGVAAPAGYAPYTGGGGGAGPGPAVGGVHSDRAQQQRIDSIYEQERCADGRVVSIHVGC